MQRVRDASGRIPLEIAVETVAGARIAEQQGASRLELCAALAATGGLTPSLGTIEAVTDAVDIPAFVLVRPRAGAFRYSADERDVTIRDARAAVRAGASGLVIGATTAEGDLDVDALRSIRDAVLSDASECTLVLHRAIDIITEWRVALDAVIDLGFSRVLTSGGAPRAAGGAERIREMAAHVSGALEIQAGGGVRIPDISTLVSAGADAIHLSARGSISSGPVGPGGGEPLIDVTDASLVMQAREALDHAAATLRQ